MTNCKSSLHPLLSGLVIALASVLVVTTVSQYTLASGLSSGGGGGGCSGGGDEIDGGSCLGGADIDIAEAAATTTDRWAN